MRSIFFSILAALVLLPGAAFAHATGASLEAVVGTHKVDIGYDPADPSAGQPIRFDFNIVDQAGNDEVFTDVWVRLANGGQTVFAGPIHRAEFGRTGITAPVLASGEHQLYVRFMNGEEKLAEHTFAFPVFPAAPVPSTQSNQPWLMSLAAGLVGLGLGVSATLIMGKKTSRAS